MANKKFQEYLDMTTRAKKYGGANNYQAFLVALGAGGGIGLKWLFDSIKERKKARKEPELSKEVFQVKELPIEFENELGEAKDKILVGTKFKVEKSFKIGEEKAVFIEIIGDDNNPYLLREEILEKISSYNSLKSGKY